MHDSKDGGGSTASGDLQGCWKLEQRRSTTIGIQELESRREQRLDCRGQKHIPRAQNAYERASLVVLNSSLERRRDFYGVLFKTVVIRLTPICT